MSKRPSIGKTQNLTAEWIAAAPYGPSETSWVVGWVFSDKETGERVMREVAQQLAAKK